MRSNVHVRNIRALSKATALFGIASLISACSSDVSRLDEMLTSSVQATSNQSAIIKPGINPGIKPGASSNFQPYPGDFAQKRDGIQVIQRKVQSTAPVVQGVVPSTVSRSSLPAVNAPRPALPSVPTVTPPPIPQKTTAYNPGAPIVLKPRTTAPNPLRVSGVDPVTTSSVAPVTSAITSNVQKTVGWDSSRGTRVAVREGETLYNLSRRYGVPVSAILAANNISDANNVMAGSQILIPTYNYGNGAPVSAPDNNPVTRVSRSSRGFQGQARGRVAVPKAREVPLPVAQPAPDRTASNTGSGDYYVVQPGDTLYGISLKTGQSVSAIKSQNNMTSDTVRIGQKLALSAPIANRVDRTVTGSIPKPDATLAGQKPVVKTQDKVALLEASKPKVTQPVTSQSGSFRWPAEGRLLSKFGDRGANGANDGIDISVPEGTPVKATQAGTVIYSGSELEDFGKLILLSHEGGWVSAYAHASSTLVRRGQKVSRGQIIAKSGRTGNATVPKLHFELRKNSNPVNPLKHLAR